MEHEDNLTGGDYITEYRLYDPRIGRWLSIDPKAREYASWSPYVNNLNNPIIYLDPNGDFAFAGALIGFGVGVIKEIGSQIIGNGIKNLAAGDNFFKGFIKKINWIQVTNSGLQGAFVGMGVPPAALAIVGLVAKTTNASVELTIEEGVKTTYAKKGEHKKSLGDAAKDLATDIVLDKINFGSVVGEDSENLLRESARTGVEALTGTETELMRDNTIDKAKGMIEEIKTNIKTNKVIKDVQQGKKIFDFPTKKQLEEVHGGTTS